MENPEKCEHDFRRVYAADITAGRSTERSIVVAVLCCNCGVSPIWTLTREGGEQFTVNGEWPATHAVTGYYFDDVEGPSVEFVVREERDERGDKAVG